MPVNDEAGLLLSYLRAQREHVVGILDGLDDDALRRPVLPTGWSCLDMVSHLTHDIERFWFQAVVLGDADTITWMAQGNDVWNVSAVSAIRSAKLPGLGATASFPASTLAMSTRSQMSRPIRAT